MLLVIHYLAILGGGGMLPDFGDLYTFLVTQTNLVDCDNRFSEEAIRFSICGKNYKAFSDVIFEMVCKFVFYLLIVIIQMFKPDSPYSMYMKN